MLAARKRPRASKKDDDYDSDPTKPPDETPAAVDTTLVFQCKACLRLLGDSWSYIDTNRALGYVVLSETTENVRARPGLSTSLDEQSDDLGATFAVLECAGCGEAVGRRYRTTPRELDGLRDAFSLGINSIHTYQIGSNKTGLEPKAPLQQEQPQPAVQAPPPDDKLERTRFLVVHLSKRLDTFEERLTQTQEVVRALQPSQEPGAQQSHDPSAP